MLLVSIWFNSVIKCVYRHVHTKLLSCLLAAVKVFDTCTENTSLRGVNPCHCWQCMKSCFDAFWQRKCRWFRSTHRLFLSQKWKVLRGRGYSPPVSLSCSLWCLCVSCAALLTSLTLLSWTVPLGQQWPALDHGEVVVVVFCCFLLFFYLFVIHYVSRHTVSFSFSVVLTAVPLQLDIERWVWNIV